MEGMVYVVQLKSIFERLFKNKNKKWSKGWRYSSTRPNNTPSPLPLPPALSTIEASGRDVAVPPAGAAAAAASCSHLRAGPAVVAAAAALVAARGAVHGEGAAGADGGEADPAGARRHAHARPRPAARGPPRGRARRRPVPLLPNHHRRRRALQRPPGQVTRRLRAQMTIGLRR